MTSEVDRLCLRVSAHGPSLFGLWERTPTQRPRGAQKAVRGAPEAGWPRRGAGSGCGGTVLRSWREQILAQSHRPAKPAMCQNGPSAKAERGQERFREAGNKGLRTLSSAQIIRGDNCVSLTSGGCLRPVWLGGVCRHVWKLAGAFLCPPSRCGWVTGMAASSATRHRLEDVALRVEGHLTSAGQPLGQSPGGAKQGLPTRAPDSSGRNRS